MKTYSIPLALYFIISISSVSSQGEGSCVGRCGQGYTRSDPCHCDYTCMSYMECCQDFKTVCTSDGSCKGRCHEGFIRGQTCDCDPGCGKFGKCCPDFEESCAQPTQNARPPSSSPDQPVSDDRERERPPEPTKKPEDQVPEDVPEDPNKKPSSPKDKKRPSKKSPKKPKKKKKQVESEEESEESEDSMSTSSFSSSSSSNAMESKTTKKHSKKNQKKNNPDDPDDPDEDNGDGKPKKPKGTGDENENPDGPPKEPNQRDPDDGDDGKTRKPKTPKDKEGDDPDDTGKPKEPNPKDKKKPKNPSSEEIEENIEERTDVNSANNDENTSTSNQRTTRKRSPSNPKKKPRKPEDDTDDPSDDPSGKGKKKPNSKKPNKKKGKPSDDDEPLKPGKGKKTKKKPNSKDVPKKKKVDSEEERQETLESEFSSSSSSSSSHTSSKTTSRRKSGKNKKKKKNPEPEDPLAPPKRIKDKGSPPTPATPATPATTFKDEGSGDDGSGLDFLSTTRSATTLMVHSTTIASQTTKERNQTEATVIPTKSPTENPAVTTEKEKTSTSNILTTKEGTEKTTSVMTTSTQSPTTEERTTEKSTSTETPLQQSKNIKHTTEMNNLEASVIVTHNTVDGNINDVTTVPSQNDGSTVKKLENYTVGKDIPNSMNSSSVMEMATTETIDGKNGIKSTLNPGITRLKTDSVSNHEIPKEVNKETSPYHISKYNPAESTARTSTVLTNTDNTMSDKGSTEDITITLEDIRTIAQTPQGVNQLLISPEATKSPIENLVTLQKIQSPGENKFSSIGPSFGNAFHMATTLSEHFLSTTVLDEMPRTLHVFTLAETQHFLQGLTEVSHDLPTATIDAASSRGFQLPTEYATNRLRLSPIASRVTPDVSPENFPWTAPKDSINPTQKNANSILSALVSKESSQDPKTETDKNIFREEKINTPDTPDALEILPTERSTYTEAQNHNEKQNASQLIGETLPVTIKPMATTAGSNRDTAPSTADIISTESESHSKTTAEKISNNPVTEARSGQSRPTATPLPTEWQLRSTFQTLTEKQTPYMQTTTKQGTGQTVPENLKTIGPTDDKTSSDIGTTENTGQSKSVSDASNLSHTVSITTQGKSFTEAITNRVETIPTATNTVKASSERLATETMLTASILDILKTTLSTIASEVSDKDDTKTTPYSSKLTTEAQTVDNTNKVLSPTNIHNSDSTTERSMTVSYTAIVTTAGEAEKSTTPLHHGTPPTQAITGITQLQNTDGVQSTLSPSKITAIELSPTTQNTEIVKSTTPVSDHSQHVSSSETAIIFQTTDVTKQQNTGDVQSTLSPSKVTAAELSSTIGNKESFSTERTDPTLTSKDTIISSNTAQSNTLPTTGITKQSTDDVLPTETPSTISETDISPTAKTKEFFSTERADLTQTSKDTTITSNTPQIITLQTTDITKPQNTDDVQSPSIITATELSPTVQNIEIGQSTTSATDSGQRLFSTDRASTLQATDVTKQQNTDDVQSTINPSKISATELSQTIPTLERTDPTVSSTDTIITSSTPQTNTMQTTDITKQPNTDDVQSTLTPSKISSTELSPTVGTKESVSLGGTDPTLTSKDTIISSKTAEIITMQTTDITKQTSDDVLTTLTPSKISGTISPTIEMKESFSTEGLYSIATSKDTKTTSNTAQTITQQTSDITKQQNTDDVHSTLIPSKVTVTEQSPIAETKESFSSGITHSAHTSKDTAIISSNTAQTITLQNTDTTKHQSTDNVQSTLSPSKISSTELSPTVGTRESFSPYRTDLTHTSKNTIVSSDTTHTNTLQTSDITKQQSTDDVQSTLSPSKITATQISPTVGTKEAFSIAGTDPTLTSKNTIISSNTAETNTLQTSDITKQNTDDALSTLTPSKITGTEISPTVEMKKSFSTEGSYSIATSNDAIITSNTAQTITLKTTDITKQQNTDDIQSTLSPSKITATQLSPTVGTKESFSIAGTDPTLTSKNTVMSSNTAQTNTLKTSDITKQTSDDVLTTLTPSKITGSEISPTVEMMASFSTEGLNSIATSKDTIITSNTAQTIIQQTTDITKQQNTDVVQSTSSPTKVTVTEQSPIAETKESFSTEITHPAHTSKDTAIITSNTAQTITLQNTDTTEQQSTDDVQSTLSPSKITETELSPTVGTRESFSLFGTDLTHTSKITIVSSNTAQTNTLQTSDITKKSTDDVLSTATPSKITATELSPSIGNVDIGQSTSEKASTLQTMDVTKQQNTDGVQSTLTPSKITVTEQSPIAETKESFSTGITHPAHTSKDMAIISSNTEQTITLQNTETTKQQSMDDVQSTLTPSKISSTELSPTVGTRESFSLFRTDPTLTSKTTIISSNTAQTNTLQTSDITKQSTDDVLSTATPSKISATELSPTVKNIEIGQSTSEKASTVQTMDVTKQQNTDDVYSTVTPSKTTGTEISPRVEMKESFSTEGSFSMATTKDTITISNTAQAITLQTTDITKHHNTDDVQSTLSPSKVTTIEVSKTVETKEPFSTENMDSTHTPKDTVISNTGQTITLQTTDITKQHNTDDVQSTLTPSKFTATELSPTAENMEVEKGTQTSVSNSSQHSSSNEQDLLPTTATINTNPIYSTIGASDAEGLGMMSTNERQTERTYETSPKSEVTMDSLASTTIQSPFLSEPHHGGFTSLAKSTEATTNKNTPISTSFRLLDKYYTSSDSSRARTLSHTDTTRDQNLHTENEQVNSEMTDSFSVTMNDDLDSSRIKTTHGLTTLHITVSPTYSQLPHTTGKIQESGGSSTSRQDLGGSTDQNVPMNAVSNTMSTGNIVMSTSYMSLHNPSFNFTVSTLKTPQDQSTTDSSGITHTAVSGKLQETTNSLSYSSEPVDPTKQTLPITDNAATQKSDQAQTTVITESTTAHSDHTISSENNIKGTSIEPQQTLTTKQSVILTTLRPEDESAISTIMNENEPEPTPTKGTVFETTKDTDDTKLTIRPTKTPNSRGNRTNRPIKPEVMENFKPTNPSTNNPDHVCDLLKKEAMKLSISDDDLQRVNEICTEMQQLYSLVSTPSPDVQQPNTGDRKYPPSYPHQITPNGNQQPGTRIIQIVDEIYRRMNNSPMTNLTDVHSYTIHRPSIWVLLRNNIRSYNDPQKNLCNGQPVDGITTLQNGSMVAFRGHYFWTLSQGGVMGCPRKITEVWGVPSPIDTVFTRCNCGGKTFFFKGPRYWRFSNDVMDQGYPKEILKGFGGLRGKVTAVLPVAGFRRRPESVYFFKPSGFVQKYTFRQEQAKRCTKKKRPTVQYPIYSKNIQTVKYRFPRDVVRHRIQIHRTFANVQQPLGMLHEQTTVRLTWRGIPNNIVSAVSLPNYKKQDGFDYYVFNKDKYYNINMSSKTAVKPQPGSEQNTSKDFYNCKE